MFWERERFWSSAKSSWLVRPGRLSGRRILRTFLEDLGLATLLRSATSSRRTVWILVSYQTKWAQSDETVTCAVVTDMWRYVERFRLPVIRIRLLAECMVMISSLSSYDWAGKQLLFALWLWPKRLFNEQGWTHGNRHSSLVEPSFTFFFKSHLKTKAKMEKKAPFSREFVERCLKIANMAIEDGTLLKYACKVEKRNWSTPLTFVFKKTLNGKGSWLSVEVLLYREDHTTVTFFAYFSSFKPYIVYSFYYFHHHILYKSQIFKFSFTLCPLMHRQFCN